MLKELAISYKHIERMLVLTSKHAEMSVGISFKHAERVLALPPKHAERVLTLRSKHVELLYSVKHGYTPFFIVNTCQCGISMDSDNGLFHSDNGLGRSLGSLLNWTCLVMQSE